MPLKTKTRRPKRAVEKAGPWKARKTKNRFSSLPSALGNPAQPAGFPLFPQPRLLLVSQTTSGNLIVVDRKECLTPDKALTNRFLRSHASVESIRNEIEGHTTIREKVPASVELPL